MPTVNERMKWISYVVWPYRWLERRIWSRRGESQEQLPSPAYSRDPYVRGTQLERDGDTEGAIAAYQHATIKNPESFGSYLSLARLLLQRERYPEARAAIVQAFRIDRASSAALEVFSEYWALTGSDRKLEDELWGVQFEAELLRGNLLNGMDDSRPFWRRR